MPVKGKWNAMNITKNPVDDERRKEKLKEVISRHLRWKMPTETACGSVHKCSQQHVDQFENRGRSLG